MQLQLLASLCFASYGLAGPSVASLGSSYSSGFGLTNSYGKLLADLLAQKSGQPAVYDNFAVAGTNVTAITQSQAARLAGSSYDVVVVTSGGNDLNYVSCLLSPGQSYCGQTIEKSEYISRFTAGLDAIVRNLANARQTPIYVVTYTQAIGSDTVCADGDADCSLTASQVQTTEELYGKLIRWTYKAIKTWQAVPQNKDYQLRVIPMEEYSYDRHDVNACEPWINGAVNRADVGDGASWHPNEAGAQFMAEAVFNDLQGLGSPLY